MRYLINDDDFEDYVEKLKIFKTKIEETSMVLNYKINIDDLEYVIEQMEADIEYHTARSYE